MTPAANYERRKARIYAICRKHAAAIAAVLPDDIRAEFVEATAPRKSGPAIKPGSRRDRERTTLAKKVAEAL